jgi:alpha-L-rhamnosidase
MRCSGSPSLPKARAWRQRRNHRDFFANLPTKSEIDTIMKLILSAILFTLIALGESPASAVGAAEVAGLRCEFMITPLGIEDARPALSWTIRDDRRGVVQTAYRVMVASSEELLSKDQGDLWDSGEVTSDQSHLVSYAGKPLVSRQRCFWKVLVKTVATDGKQTSGVWSQPSWWEMGLLRASDWQGSWIQSAACKPMDDEMTRLWTRMCVMPPELNDLKKNPASAEKAKAAAREKLDAILPAPVFRRTFSVLGTVKRARIYLSGLGFHEATLNGQPVSDHIHDPSITQYKVRGGYVTHDIGSLVRGGSNEIVVVLGSGLFNEPVVWGAPGEVDGLPSLRAQIEVELTDGSRIVVASDKSWQTAVGPLLKSHYWAGEVFDARRLPGEGDAKWIPSSEVAAPVPALVAQRCEPERIIRRVKPVAVTQPKPGVWVFDLGEIIVGTLELRVKAPAGSAIVMRTAEWTWNPKIQGPQFRASHLHYDDSANSEFADGMILARMRGGTFLGKIGNALRHIGTPTLVYVARGDAAGEMWRPSFTLQPMRYIEVQGLKETPTLDLLTGLVVTSDEEVVGSFTSGNSRFNDIFEACMNSTRYTTHGMSWDNAVERLQSQVYNAWSAPFASYLLWYPNLWRKILEDQRLVNHPEPGPDQRFANVVYGERGGPGWAIKSPGRLVIPESVIVELPMQLCDRYGDLRELRRHVPQMKAWLEACVDPATGKFRKGAFAGGWNDHFCIETAADSEFLPSFDEQALMGMMLYQWTRDTAAAGRMLGRHDDAAAMDQMARTVRLEVNRSFYDPTNKTYGAAKEKSNGKLDTRYGWHGLMATAIATGIAPEADIPAILDNCIADMKAHYRSHHAAGHITHQLLYDVFSDHGMIETCHDMMNATGFPSFAYQLQSGNRTIPEGPAWTDKFPAFASAYQNECQEPARWFTQTLCGIAPDRAEPGFKHILLRPRIPARLPSASLTTTTPYGALESSWKQRDGTVIWTVRIPANSHATAWIPASSVDAILADGQPLAGTAGCMPEGQGTDSVKCRLGSGVYRFQFPAPVNMLSRLSELK